MKFRLSAALGLALLGLAAAPTFGAAPAAPPAWVERSNANAQKLLQVMAKYSPEQAGFFGVTGFDDQITDLQPGYEARSRAAVAAVVAEYEQLARAEQDPKVRQDLEILIQAGKLNNEQSEVNDRAFIPYTELNQTVFQGLRALLDEQVPAERRKAALVRLRKYAGVEPGTTPIAELAMRETREKLSAPGLLGPSKQEMEKNFQNGATFRDGIGKLFAKYGLKGYEPAYKKLVGQLTAYDKFLKDELAPKARTDFRLPAEVYAVNLKNVGIDMPIDELVSRAQVSFREIQNEMTTLAGLIAKQRNLPSADYRDVIHELKKEQIVGDAILKHYQDRIAQIEDIIRRERIVTLPERPMQIRLASEAESAAIPAPNMHPPRLLGNTGERGEFVLPLRIPGENGKVLEFDDFSHAGESWTLTAHEGRPGHELQFSRLIEDGVSIARGIFAFNSVNVEGWALYSEAEMKPYEPLEGQLFAAQNRLLRAARAILDPGLQRGQITQEEAFRVLEHDVVVSHPMALQEVERYSFMAPGQAVSYFCGYQRLMELRTEAERDLGAKFDRLRYHDFILGQGMVPPSLLRKAVLEEFVPAEKARN
ncbi:MAG: DUF885 domain-containing protein [Acidobacteriota bacterium]